MIRCRCRTRTLVSATALMILTLPASMWLDRVGSANAFEAHNTQVEDGSPEPMTREEIAADYTQQLQALQQQRIERLTALARTQDGAERELTLEQIFSLAILENLCLEAEPAAELAIEQADQITLPQVKILAQVVNILAEAQAGQFEKSLASLRTSLGQAQRDRDPILPIDTILTVSEAYYQRLLQARQFAIARQASQLVIAETIYPEVRRYWQERLEQLDLIGQPAPPIVGVDVDGQPFDLADLRGQVVLVVFWTTWNAQSIEALPLLNAAQSVYGDRGLRIVGINLDTLQANLGDRAAQIPTQVRRILLDYNVGWTNLIVGDQGNSNIAEAYNVYEVPSNALIGRDGSVVELELTGLNYRQAFERALGADVPER